MKKIGFLIPFVLSSLLIINMVNIVSASGLQVTFVTNPSTAAAGTNGYLEVNIKSTGTTNNIEISAESWDPSVITQLGNWNQEVSSLDAGDSYSLLYEFRVSSTANPGLYQVIFDIDYSGGGTTHQTAIIKVEDPVVLDLTSITPTSIKIGEATTLVFNISNNGGAAIENILFTWEDPNDLILPIGSDNRIRIPTIPGDNYTEIPIAVMASSGISPGVYPLTITLEFYDQAGTEQTVTSTVGIQISGTTTFDVVVQQSTSGSTTFSVVNTGANVASSVIVSIPQQLNYATSGASSSSLGNLDAGDYTLATFQIVSTAGNSTSQFPGFNRSGMDAPSGGRNFSGRNTFMNQSITGLRGNGLLVEITYTDVFGVRQTVQKQVTLSTASSFGALSSTSSRTGTQTTFRGLNGQSQSSDGSNNSLVYIAIGVVGIIIIIGIIQLGRKKKLARFSKLFKGRKKE